MITAKVKRVNLTFVLLGTITLVFIFLYSSSFQEYEGQLETQRLVALTKLTAHHGPSPDSSYTTVPSSSTYDDPPNVNDKWVDHALQGLVQVAERRYCAVMLDSRPQVFERPVTEMLKYLDKRWNLRLIVVTRTAAYREFVYVETALKKQAWYKEAQRKLHAVYIHQIPARNIPQHHFANYVLTDVNLYRIVVEPRILIFAADTAVCSNNHRATPDGLVFFMDQYDWIGGPIPLDDVKCCNGAFSVRSRKLMLTCLAKYPFTVDVKNENLYIAEDVFFSRCLTLENELEGNPWTTIPTVAEGLEMASTRGISSKSLAVHDPCNYNCASMEQGVQYCPEAMNIMVADKRPPAMRRFCNNEKCHSMLHRVAKELNFPLDGRGSIKED